MVNPQLDHVDPTVMEALTALPAQMEHLVDQVLPNLEAGAKLPPDWDMEGFWACGPDGSYGVLYDMRV